MQPLSFRPLIENMLKHTPSRRWITQCDYYYQPGDLGCIVIYCTGKESPSVARA